MATFGERVDHALVARGHLPADLDKFLAARFHKKGSGTGYTHRVIEKNQKPGAPVVAAICEYLEISERWLLTGQGDMNIGAGVVPVHRGLEHEVGVLDLAVDDHGAHHRRRVADCADRIRLNTTALDLGLGPLRPAGEAVVGGLSAAPDAEREAVAKAEAERLKAEEDKRSP